MMMMVVPSIQSFLPCCICSTKMGPSSSLRSSVSAASSALVLVAGNGSKQSNYSWGNPTKGWPWLLANQNSGRKMADPGILFQQKWRYIYIYMYRYSLLLFVWIVRGLVQWLKWRGIVCHVDQEPLISCVSCWAKNRKYAAGYCSSSRVWSCSRFFGHSSA